MTGRVGKADQALVVPTEPCSTVSALTGFDPSRNGAGDTRNYKRTFFGILNKRGQFWTPLIFEREMDAWTHIERFWRDDPDNLEYCRKHFKVVPVHATLALAAAARRGGDVQQAPAESPQSGGEAVTPNPSSSTLTEHPGAKQND